METVLLIADIVTVVLADRYKNSSSRSRYGYSSSQIDIGIVLLVADVVIVLLTAECSLQQIW